MSIVPEFTRDVFANIKQGARDATVAILDALGDGVDDVIEHLGDGAASTGEVVANDSTAMSVDIAVNDDEVVVRVVVGG